LANRACGSRDVLRHRKNIDAEDGAFYVMSIRTGVKPH